ncbi:MAG TPA: M56 family metallopeptidase [Tepidisphaeraceae bacterium]|nr:M56 family metallopeptidase [Tepidisphaeraceae bacterium]
MVFDPATLERFAWTLLHFLWQGAVVFAAARIALATLVNHSASSRYAALCVASMAMAAAPIITFAALHSTFDDPGPLILFNEGSGGAAGDAVVAGTHAAGLAGRVAAVVRPFAGWLAFGWLGGAFVAWGQGLYQWLWLRRVLLTAAVPLRAPLSRVSAVAGRLGLNGVRFLESNLVGVPATIGWLKPVVLLPPAALSGLTIEQLEAIVAHELAHVLRRDYLVNIVQTLAETTLFYHPAVWWLSRRLREERENCCDDIAVRVTGDANSYAAALLRLEEIRSAASSSPPALVMAAADEPLYRRIVRLLPRPRQKHARQWVAAPAGSVALAAVLGLGAAELFAAAVVVRPDRSLAQVETISGEIYRTLGVSSAGRPMLPHLDAAIAQLRSGELTNATLRPLAVALNASSADELTDAALQVISVADAAAHQSDPRWTHGSAKDRSQIVHRLRSAARECRGRLPADARLFARASLLLSAQDSVLLGAAPTLSLLREPGFADLTGLSSRQLARVRRHLADHATITRIFINMLIRAEREIGNASTREGAASHLAHAAVEMLKLAGARPDIHWCVQNLHYRHRGLREDVVVGRLADGSHDEQLVRTPAMHVEAGHSARWLAPDARPPTPSIRSTVPLTHAQLTELQNVSGQARAMRAETRPEAP